ncbi:MAG: mitochondrial fission ELM1 family protein [Pseudomonadota bacterium]|nr:mitochondrial fission ELM1 family protein [Pseudomonadota bacterium]
MKKTLWTLMDDRRGSVGQALGILNMLPEDISVVEKKLIYTKTAGLPNWLRGRTLIGLDADSRKKIAAPWPDYVLSISRRTAPVARYIKKQNPQTKLIQLMHPGKTGLSDFDLVIVPEHDKNKGFAPNIHYITGCPHRITGSYLQEAQNKWQKKFADLPKPLTALIIGGAIKGKPFSNENALALGKAVRSLKKKIGGSLLITTSRRTGKDAERLILEQLKDIPQFSYLWGDTSENPYSGFLACADNLIVTGDSVSMCCEATGTGKPIYLFTGSKWLTPKHLRFVQSLCDTGCAVLLDSPQADSFKPQKSLNAAAEVAGLICRL